MATRSAKNKDQFRINISDVSFDVSPDEKAGEMKIKYTVYDADGSRDVNVSFLLLSIWRDRTENCAIRAYARFTRRSQKHFYESLLALRSLSIRNFHIQASPMSGQRVLVYRVNSIRDYQNWDIDEGENRIYYCSKADALKAILDEIRSDHPVGGLNTTSLSNVSDETMIAIGFEKVEDMLGTGRPMWKGTTEIFSTDSYSRYTRSSSEGKRSKEIKSFLDMLSKELKA